VEAPKFLPAKDARNRFAREPALSQCRNGLDLGSRKHAVGLDHQLRMVEAERMADDKARVKLRCVETVLAERKRKVAPRGTDCSCGCPAIRWRHVRRHIWSRVWRHMAPSAASSPA